MSKIEVTLHILAWVSLYFVIFQLIPSVILEAGRQKLFEIRDNLFDYHHKHPTKLDRQTYQSIRNHLNHTIKTMEYITWPRILASNFLPSHHIDADKEMAQLYMPIQNEETREYIKSLLKKSIKHTITTLILRSPLLLFLITTLIIPLALITYITPPNKKIRHSIVAKIKNEVYESMVLVNT